MRRLRLPAGHRFPRHSHADWSIGLVAAGAVRLWRGGVWHPVVRDEATVLHPGETHEGLISTDEGLRYFAVTAPVGLVGRLADPPREFAGLVQPPGSVRRLVAATDADAPEERRERSLNALAMLFTWASRTPPADRPGRLLAAEVRRQLDDTFLRPVRICDLAAAQGVAPAVVIRQFRRSFGLSPYAYVISRRVDHARHLLDAGVSPADAAGRAGFYDQPHLNRHFNRLVGMSPGTYRRS